MARAYPHGWLALPNGGEVEVEHGIPMRVWVPDRGGMSTAGEDIRTLTGFKVTMGSWEVAEPSGEAEAEVHVDPAAFGEVLRVLAHASAETFYDRYRKHIDAGDTDFDDEAFALDFGAALRYCGMRWNQVDQQAFHDSYVRSLHLAADQIERHHH